MPPDLSRSRKSVSIYSRSPPGLLPQPKNVKALTSTFSNKYNRQLASYFIEPSPFQKYYHTGLRHVFFSNFIALFLFIRLNKRGEYLSIRDPEWWIQSNSTPWMNPYARWGTEHCTSLYEERYIRPEFVVSVDTSNPDIRRMLEDGLNKAENMLYEKSSFAVEVSGVRIEAFFCCFRTDNIGFGYSFKFWLIQNLEDAMNILHSIHCHLCSLVSWQTYHRSTPSKLNSNVHDYPKTL